MRRVWILVGAFVATVAVLVLSMILGSATFDYRRFAQHQRRLERVMREHPTAERLTQGLKDEGSPLLAAPATAEERRRVIAEFGGSKAAEIRDKAQRYPHLRVFGAADMLYFVFFDASGVMRDFTCVSR
jgi:hypothetical protein